MTQQPEVLILTELKEGKILEAFLSTNEIKPDESEIENLYTYLFKVFESENLKEKSEFLVKFVRTFFQICESFRCPNFFNLFNAFFEFESILYVVLPKYRDHLIHSGRIFVFLVYIISSIRYHKTKSRVNFSI